ncbi:Bromodomain-containing protein, partial [Aureobasidium melanogenum]
MLEGLEEYAEKADKAEKAKRQRWPRPCSICQSRKVKCDRGTPCTNCQRRGEEHLCIPEVERPNGLKRKRKAAVRNVSVGNIAVEDSVLVITAPDPPSEPIELTRSAFEIEEDQPQHSFESFDQVCANALSKTQMHLRPQPRWNQLVLPNSKTSTALVAHDKIWNSWVHNALHYARFEKEHETFLIMRQSGKPITSMESSWLALYFAVLAASFLSMSEKQAETMELPIADHPTLFRRWYDAALFCLDEAEYMRKPSVRTVQTIAVLGICFDNVGDHDLRQTMWAVAIRIALRLNLNHPEKMAAPLPMPVEQCIRLWWTIAIHDLVPVPGYIPLVTEHETRCSLPGSISNTDDLTVEHDGSTISSSRYQAFMARAAIVYNNFHSSFQERTMTKSELVRQADERLRQLTARLPDHLTLNGSIRNATITKLEADHPWIHLQRVNVTRTYLTYRLSIYSTLEPNWRSHPGEFNWAKSICLQTAFDITTIDTTWDMPKSYRRHWHSKQEASFSGLRTMASEAAMSQDNTPVPSTEGATQGQTMSEAELDQMQSILDFVYDYRTPDGHDPSKVFHRKVNKRALPHYYEIIKDPMAMSTIKAKINNKEYKNWSEFVRDWAQIVHNAQVFNRADAGAYQDALTIRDVVTTELKKLVDLKIISEEVSQFPYLGEIPPQDDVPPEEEDDDEDEDDEEDDDIGGDDSDDDGGKRKRKRGRPSKRDRDLDKDDDPETRKKRGRPPKVLTPVEARIQAVLKGIRKPKGAGGLKITSFERLPDKAVMPEYYAEIREPMAFDVLKRKLKRKKYQSLEQFMKDVDLMFDNAKSYNQDESQIYKDAVELQAEAHRLADEERNKPDTDYVMDEGRIPLPNGILYNGELYKVGDWVHVQNANDLTKPIPCQIYRTWQDPQGGQWVNVCWYYRPEQTVHRFDKHFLENEVVKTGQYRDHRVDEIVGRCFIMFTTRYYKGRPRRQPADLDIYVCEARYNEEKFKFNKIKTWASCLPDEVRDRDYEMDLFDMPRKMRKIPSPIAYLLKDTDKETDDMPKPEWGAENAPPKIGAVHRRPRDPRDSPPPEPTPSPPPQPAIAQAQARQSQSSHMSPSIPAATMQAYSPMQSQMTPMQTAAQPVRPMQPMTRPSHTPAPVQPYTQNHSASPAPMPSLQRASSGQFNPATPQHMTAMPLPRTASHPSTFQPQAPAIPPAPSASQSRLSYRDPVPIEVWTLPDTANASIPPEIRDMYQTDDQGRILFFSAPPVQLAEEANDPNKNLGHSLHYMAEKSRRTQEIVARRKAYEEGKAARAAQKKRQREIDEEMRSADYETQKARALAILNTHLTRSTAWELKAMYGEQDWKDGMEAMLGNLEEQQKLAIQRKVVMEKNAAQRAAELVSLKSNGVLFDNVENGPF